MVDLITQVPIPNAPMVMQKTGVPVKAWFDFFTTIWLRTGGPLSDASILLDGLGTTRGGMLARFATAWAEFEATVVNTVPVMNPGGVDVQLFTISQLLDLIGLAQGDVLFRGATGWQALAPVANKFLMSNGVADPTWDVPTTPATLAFKVNKNGVDQAGIVTATKTDLTWSTEVFDVGGLFTANAWTPPAGVVRLHATVQFSVNVVDQSAYFVNIEKDAVVIAQTLTVAANSSPISIDVGTTDNANGANVYTVSVRGDGAGNKTIAGNTALSWFEGNMV